MNRRFGPSVNPDLNVVLRVLPAGGVSTVVGTANFSGSWGETATVTRATAGTCLKPDGTLVTMQAGQARIEAAGLLVESAATNLCLESQTFDSGTWLKINATSAAPVVTANTGTSPEATQTGDQVAFDTANSALLMSQMYQPFTATAAAYTASVWIRKVSGPATTLRMRFSGASEPGSTLCALTSTWTRFTTTQTLTVATWNLVFGGDNSASLPQDAVVVEMWGCQIELGSLPSSYIATTGATATRNADVVSIASLAKMSDAEGAASVSMTLPSALVVANSRVLTFGTGSPGSILMASITTARINDGGASGSITLTGVASATTRLLAAWFATTMTITSNRTTASGTGTYDGTMKDTGANIYLGSTSGTTTQINGNVADVLVSTSRFGGVL